MSTPIRKWFVICRLALDTLYLHTKFGDSRFSHSGDKIAGIWIKNGSNDRGHAPFRGGLLSEGFLA